MTLRSVERDKLITNTALFLHLYERTSPEQKKANILQCLEDGADVNATDANNKSNTPSHVAVQIGDKDILLLLIDKGAILDQTNSAGKTPHDLALEIIEAKEIEELVKTSINSKPHSDKHPASASEANSNTPAPYFYEKRTGTSGVRGQLYETKLLTLVLLRLLHDKDIAEFHLGTNINQIGALDDICVRYLLKGNEKPVLLFLQAKHREKSESGKLTVEDFKKVTGDFSMLKYFLSYLKIKESFQTVTKDPLFVGEFTDMDCNFILYTPVKAEFSKKRNDIKQNNIKLNDIIQTGEGDIFQYGYDDKDIHFLTKMTVLRQLEMLAHILLEFIMSEKYSTEKIANKLIGRYHVALRREVIEVLQDDSLSSDAATNQHHTGKFRPEFFTSSSTSIVSLREYFYLEISTTHCDKTPLAEKEVVYVLNEVIREACPATVSKAIGKVVTYNEKCYKLEIIKNKTIQKQLKGLDNITESLKNITLDINTIKEATMIKLKSTKFKLPSWFGNLDMTLRGDMSKAEDKLGKLAEKFVLLFKKYGTNYIEIDDIIVGPQKFLSKGNVSVNGGIGGAVGNLLVRDQLTKMFKFDINNKNLPRKAAVFLKELTSKGISKEDLESCRINVILSDFPKYSVDEDEYLERQAKDYLDKLWFYTHQANEDAVEHIVRKEISIHYNKGNLYSKNNFLFDNHAESIFLQSHANIQKWWKRAGLVRYLNKTNDFFAQAANLLVFGNTLLVTLNFMYIKKINRYKIEFDSEVIKKWELNKSCKGLLNIVTDANLLTGAKLMQYFEEDNSTFLDIDYVLNLSLNDYDDLIKELEFTSIQILLLMYEDSENEFISQDNEDLCDKLKQIIDIYGGTIILVTDRNAAKRVKTSRGAKYKSMFDEFNFADLTESSQNIILQEAEVYFQSEPMPLISILDRNARGLIRGGLLASIFNGEKVRVGEGLWGKFEPGEEWVWVSYLWFYGCQTTKRIGAQLVQDETTWNVETLNDIKDNTDPVVVMSTSKTRTELERNTFGYLVTNTKEIHRLPWIIWHQPSIKYWIDEKDPKTIDAIIALKILMLTNFHNDVEIYKLELDEVDGQIILRNGDELLLKDLQPTDLFELELFIYLYNNNHVIFLFRISEYVQLLNYRDSYHFDKRFMLIKALKDRGKRIWIDYAQIENVRKDIAKDMDMNAADIIKLALVPERLKYESEFGKPYVLVGKYEFEYVGSNAI